jgi:hypothetical protein
VCADAKGTPKAVCSLTYVARIAKACCGRANASGNPWEPTEDVTLLTEIDVVVLTFRSRSWRGDYRQIII